MGDRTGTHLYKWWVVQFLIEIGNGSYHATVKDQNSHGWSYHDNFISCVSAMLNLGLEYDASVQHEHYVTTKSDETQSGLE